MKTAPKTDLESLFSLFRSIQRSAKLLIARNMKNENLSVSQHMILHELHHYPGITLNELSERLGLPKSTVSRLVDFLVKKDMVARQIPPENRRMVRLYLSEGYQQRKKRSGFRKELNALIYTALKPSELDTLALYLKKINDIMQKGDTK